MTNKIMALAYDYAASCERRELTGRVFARAALDKEVKAEQDYTRAVISERDALRKAAQIALDAIEELRYSSSTFKAEKLAQEAQVALRKELGE